jgi:RNA polymerase sigma-70 factor (ECF subfamily)
VRPLDYEPAAPETDHPDAAALERDLADRLRGAVGELPDREACVFSLRYFGEMSNAEIAEALAISPDAVGVALHKARTKLKELLGVEETSRRRNPQ